MVKDDADLQAWLRERIDEWHDSNTFEEDAEHGLTVE
jgi:hypothetical protein